MIDYKLKARALAAENLQLRRALDRATLTEISARRDLREIQARQIKTRAVVSSMLGWDPAAPANLDDLAVVLDAAAAIVDTRGPAGCDLCDAPTIHNLRRAILAGRKK